MTLNVIAGAGMLGVGVLGNVWLGNLQDTNVVDALEASRPELVARYVEDRPPSIFGDYRALTDEAVALRDAGVAPDAEVLASVTNEGKMTALRKVVILPVIMLAAYLGLLLWFRARGGYRPVEFDRLASDPGSP